MLLFEAEFEVDEGLVEFESILIRRARASDAAVRETALDLREETDVGSGVNIRMNEISLEKISIGILWPRAETGMGKAFVALANFPTE